MSLVFTSEAAPIKVTTVKWPAEPSYQEISLVRRERIALIMALKDRRFDYVEKALDIDWSEKSLFWLQTIALLVWPAREYLKNGTVPRDILLSRMKLEGFDEEVIKKYMHGMYDGNP